MEVALAVRPYDSRDLEEQEASNDALFPMIKIGIGEGEAFFYYRPYNPETGTFISEDPIGFGGGDPNLYRYVFNNSINFTDPHGLNPRLLAALYFFYEIFGEFTGLTPEDVTLSIVTGTSIGPTCLNEGEEEFLRNERVRQDYEERKRLLKERGIDLDNLPHRPFTPNDLDINMSEPLQPQFRPDNGGGIPYWR